MASASRAVWPLGLLAAAVLAADQSTKYAVDKLMVPGASRVLIPGLLNFVHASNPGVAFGMLADSEMPWRAQSLMCLSRTAR